MKDPIARAAMALVAMDLVAAATVGAYVWQSQTADRPEHAAPAAAGGDHRRPATRLPGIVPLSIDRTDFRLETARPTAAEGRAVPQPLVGS